MIKVYFRFGNNGTVMQIKTNKMKEEINSVYRYYKVKGKDERFASLKGVRLKRKKDIIKKMLNIRLQELFKIEDRGEVSIIDVKEPLFGGLSNKAILEEVGPLSENKEGIFLQIQQSFDFIPQIPNEGIKIGSLFSGGIDGMVQGFQMASDIYKPVVFIDIDKQATWVKKNDVTVK